MGNCSCLQASSSSAAAAAASAVESKLRRLSSVIIVVHSVEGRVMEVGAAGTSLTVAELMMEFPGHFVCECETDISATQEEITSICIMMKRAAPLPADHEASPGRIYILFPMHRLHTRVSPQESALLNSCISSHLAAASPSSKKKQKPHHHLHGLQGSSKVTPLNMHSSPHQQEEENLPHSAHDEQLYLSEEEMDSILQQFCSSQLQQKGSGISFNSATSRLMRSKSWIPKLETISESSTLSAEIPLL